METEKLEIIEVGNIIYFDFKNNKILPRYRFKTKGEIKMMRIKQKRDENNKRITEEYKQLKK